MSDEYLWNRAGEPDKDVIRLEKLLGQFRYPEPRKRRPAFWWLAAAAVLIAGLGGVLWRRSPLTEWQFVNGNRLRTGQLVETGASKSVSIESQFTGRVDVDPRSRLRLLSSGNGEQRFHLERGTIHALIWAPPGRFVVDTPSAKTIDLGCRYTLQVSGDGNGLVTVETGWVAFEWEKRESFIPAGAACVTRPALGPGTPWFRDAPEQLKTALGAFDTGSGDAALVAALGAVRERDALTVWHLMVRTQGRQRGEVYDRFAGLVQLPAYVTREAVLRGDSAALDGAWNALELGSTEWWREWKRKW
jgi:hypothetical protein